MRVIVYAYCKHCMRARVFDMESIMHFPETFHLAAPEIAISRRTTLKRSLSQLEVLYIHTLYEKGGTTDAVHLLDNNGINIGTGCVISLEGSMCHHRLVPRGYAKVKVDSMCGRDPFHTGRSKPAIGTINQLCQTPF